MKTQKEMLKDLLERVEKLEKKINPDLSEGVILDIRPYTKSLKDFSHKKPWPQEGDKYWLALESGGTTELQWDNDGLDRSYKGMGNLFRTKEEAEKELKLRKAITRVRLYIEENFGVFEPDWKDTKQGKFGIHYNQPSEGLDFDFQEFYTYHCPYGHLQSIENINQLIKDCEDDLLTIHRS